VCGRTGGPPGPGAAGGDRGAFPFLARREPLSPRYPDDSGLPAHGGPVGASGARPESSKPSFKVLLLKPTFVWKDGKVQSVTGQCCEKGCSNVRTIKTQDAFQVRRCEKCQRKEPYRRNAERRADKKASRETAMSEP